MRVNAFWLMLGALGVYTLFYRYYSLFLARRVTALDASRTTPAHRGACPQVPAGRGYGRPEPVGFDRNTPDFPEPSA